MRFFAKYLYVSYTHERGVGWMMLNGKTAKSRITPELLQELQHSIELKESCSSCLITNWKRI